MLGTLNPGFVELINETIVCLTCAILCHTLRVWRTGAYLDPPKFKSDAVRGKSLLISRPFGQDVEGSQILQDLFLRQRNTWPGFPEETQELMLRNLRETIVDKVQKENRVLKERRDGFIDNHEAVHAELERQLSSRNPRRAAARAPTPIITGARGLEGHMGSQDASQESARSLDFSQTACARALPGLDDDQAPVTFDDALDLTLEHESAINPDPPSHLALTLDDCQDGRGAVGGNARQQEDEVM